MKIRAFMPEKNQKGAIHAKNSARSAAGYCQAFMRDQRQQIACKSACEINGGKTGVSIHALHQLPCVPERPEIEREVNNAEMEEHGATETPPFSVLRRGPKIRSPRQLHVIRGMPQARPPGEHCAEDDQIARCEKLGDRYLRYTPIKEFVERLHWRWTGFSRAVIMHEMDTCLFRIAPRGYKTTATPAWGVLSS